VVRDSRGGYGVETAVVEKTVVVETEEDINILFTTIKKKDNCPFWLIGLLFYVYNGHFVIYNLFLQIGN
jgi:hypothetical protein